MRKEREVLAKHIVDWNRAADHYRRLFRRGLITEYEAAKGEARTAFEITLYEHYFLETYRDEEGELPEFAVNLGAYEDNMDLCKRISKSMRTWRAMHTKTSLLYEVYGKENE